MPPQSNFKIAIIGAGPAGLTLASRLTASTHPFDFTVFELRDKPDPSQISVPCANLDLHQDLGLRAIKGCGLYSRFLQVESVCTEQTRIINMAGTVLSDTTGDGGRPEISRNALIQLLLESIPEERIRWGTKVLNVAPADCSRGKGKGCIRFTENANTATASTSEESYDLIVGADGAWSRTRAAIPNAPKPIYSGVCYITMYFPISPERHPGLDKMIGGGTFAVCGDNKLLLAQRAVQNTVRVCLFLHSKCQAAVRKELLSSTHNHNTGPDPLLSPDNLVTSLPSNPKKLQELLLTHDDFFASWSEDIKRLLSKALESQPTDATIITKPMYMLPLAPYPYAHQRGIALVGDAASLMTPFAGRGVNLAMVDSLDLAEELEHLQLAAAHSSGSTPAAIFADSLDEALSAYERTACARAKEAMELTWRNLCFSYNENASDLFAEVMAS
jgi:2-polyprenyl-6-methoxyphenol hydroxylase-like FAD-dependent oxidoreductase